MEKKGQLFLFFTLLLTAVTQGAWAWSGNGTAGDPYVLANADDWATFAANINAGTNVNKCYKLANDWNNENAPVTAIVGSDTYSFQGTFDGNGKTLYVSINNTQSQGTAPFSHVTGATIKNLTVEGSVTGTRHVAGLVGFVHEGGTTTLSGCVVKPNVINNTSNGEGYIGGLVGHGTTATIMIENCVFSGNLNNTHDLAGGLVGWSDNANITFTNSFFTGTHSGNGQFHPIALHYKDYQPVYTDNGAFYISTTPSTVTENQIIGLSGRVVYKDKLSENYVKITAQDGNEYYVEGITFNVRRWDAVNKKVVTTQTTKDATVLKSSSVWEPLGARDNDNDYYYVVKGNVSCTTLNCFGRVHIILADNATLTCTGGIIVQGYNNNTRLFIYSQSDGDKQGKLIVTNSYDKAAGIGSVEGEKNGTIEIHGGNLDVKGGKRAAGIGAGCCTKSTFTDGGIITIYGGVVKAKGGEFGGAGIGGGGGLKGQWSDGARFSLYGGEVTATGGENGAGVGGGGGEHLQYSEYTRGGGSGYCDICGGTLTAQGGKNGAGIGGGSTQRGSNYTDFYYIHISGGTVNATGGKYGAGIGGGINGDGDNIEISGGNVTATGGVDAAGIGGGESGRGGNNILISGGNVRAQGRSYGAGIGGGEEGDGAKVKITGGTVIAISGEDCEARENRGGSAIGCGQGLDNKDADYKAKSLTFGDNMRVTAGDSESSTEVFTSALRVPACRWRDYVKIEACPHTAQNGDDAKIVTTYTQNSDGTHTAHCRYCEYTTTAAHSFVNDVCTVCGKTQDDSDECTITVYQATSTVSSTAYDTGTTYKVLKNTPFSLSAPAAKDGLIFMGYLKDPTTVPASWEMKDADFNSLFDVGLGQRDITPTTDTKFYATYRYDYEPTWTWSPDYSSATLSVTCAAINDTQTLKVTMLEPTHTDATADANGSDAYSATASYERVSGVTYQFSDNPSIPIIYSLSLADNADNDETLHDYTGRKVNNVTLSGRTFYKDGKWNTLCLPFNATLTGDFADATLMEFDVTGKNGFDPTSGTLYLTFKKATAIAAGVPYLVKWDAAGDDFTSPVFSGVTINATASTTVSGSSTGLEQVQMVGCYSPMPVVANDKSILFLGDANTVYYSTIDRNIRSCRAYFSVPYIKGNAGAQARAFALNFEGEEATGIRSIDNGQWIIENSDGAWYSLDGRKLSGKPTKSGVYINGGKKFVIK